MSQMNLKGYAYGVVSNVGGDMAILHRAMSQSSCIRFIAQSCTTDKKLIADGDKELYNPQEVWIIDKDFKKLDLDKIIIQTIKDNEYEDLTDKQKNKEKYEHKGTTELHNQVMAYKVDDDVSLGYDYEIAIEDEQEEQDEVNDTSFELDDPHDGEIENN